MNIVVFVVVVFAVVVVAVVIVICFGSIAFPERGVDRNSMEAC